MLNREDNQLRFEVFYEEFKEAFIDSFDTEKHERQNMIIYVFKIEEKIDQWQRVVVLKEENEKMWKIKLPYLNISSWIIVKKIRKNTDLKDLLRTLFSKQK
jgi:hypothetical protein